MSLSRRGVRLLLAYCFRRWRGFAVVLGLTALLSLAAALQPWPLKLLVDHALGAQPVPSTWPEWLVGMTPVALVVIAGLAGFVFAVSNHLIDALLTRAWVATSQHMVYDLAADLFYRCQRLSLMFHRRRSVGDTLMVLSRDAWCVTTLAHTMLVAPARHFLTLGTMGAIAWHLSPSLTALTFVTVPVLAATGVIFGKHLQRRAAASRDARVRVTSFVHQVLGAVPLVQVFQREDANRRHLLALTDDATRQAQRETRVTNAFNATKEFTAILGMALVLFAGARLVLSDAMALGGLLVFLGYARSIHGASQGLLDLFGSLKTIQAGMERVMEVLDAGEEVREAPGARVLPTPRARGHVRLENVSFGYERGRPVLEGIDLVAGPGDVIALVGPSGAGKSTLAALIPRLFDPWNGSVRLDDVDVRSLTLACVRSNVAVVLQDPFLLPISVADTIAYGRVNATRAEIVAAAEMAHADEFIRRLPQGYDTVLGERGATLSGGQRQRLAIARALLKDAPVLVLDEPTAALDGQTEALVMEAIGRLVRDRTTFIIAHRLSTIRYATRIVAMDGGRIVEAGTHDQLVARDGLYARLYRRQFPVTEGAS
jgi:ATP-binding cassette subfamily B protein/subfamily B ATP-binding cassette protein MsbA